MFVAGGRPRPRPQAQAPDLLQTNLYDSGHWTTQAPRPRMADDDGAKRLKTSQDGLAIASSGRVDELLRRNAELQYEIQQLRSENARLRQPGRRLEEVRHEVLPAVVKMVVTVDLSRVDAGLVTHITSFLGTSRELLNLALTCKSFGWRQPTSTLNWSLVEEVARQTVCSRATDEEMSFLPQYVSGTTTWLTILHRHEHPLQFDVLIGGYIEYWEDENAVHATRYEYKSGVAVSSCYVMRSGAHYAEFKIGGEPFIGVVRPMPGLDADDYSEEFYFFLRRFYPDFLAQRSANWGNGNVHVCEYCCENGGMRWSDWGRADPEWEQWEGMEPCQSDDTLGMLLNLDEGTLTVYKNNRRLGAMKDGLSGAYCWYASVSDDATVEISKARIQPTANSSTD